MLGFKPGTAWLAWTVDRGSQSLGSVGRPSGKELAGKGKGPCVCVREGTARLGLGMKASGTSAVDKQKDWPPHVLIGSSDVGDSWGRGCCLSVRFLVAGHLGPLGSWTPRLQ